MCWPVRGATVRIQEHSAADCTKRAIEVWQTVPVGATPTWRTSPSKIRKLDELDTAGFCPGTSTFDVSSAVVAAAAHNRSCVTFEFRVPARHERDVSYGRQHHRHGGLHLPDQPRPGADHHRGTGRRRDRHLHREQRGRVSAEVRGRSANGWVSPRSSWSVPFFPWPGVRTNLEVRPLRPDGSPGDHANHTSFDVTQR